MPITHAKTNPMTVSLRLAQKCSMSTAPSGFGLVSLSMKVVTTLVGGASLREDIRPVSTTICQIIRSTTIAEMLSRKLPSFLSRSFLPILIGTLR